MAQVRSSAMRRRVVIDDDSDDDALLAVPFSSSVISPAAPAVGSRPPAKDAGNGIIVIVDSSSSSDDGSTAPASDGIVIVVSPCPASVAASPPRYGSRCIRLFATAVHPSNICTAALCSSSSFNRSSSNSGSSDPDDPVSRAARRAAVRLAATSTAQRQPSAITDFFRPISSSEYSSQVAAATQVDIMDLRSVVPAPAADIVTAADDGAYDLVSPPKRLRHGYVIDDFVVDTSASESEYSLSSCS
jgi:hypothetical protein